MSAKNRGREVSSDLHRMHISPVLSMSRRDAALVFRAEQNTKCTVVQRIGTLEC